MKLFARRGARAVGNRSTRRADEVTQGADLVDPKTAGAGEDGGSAKVVGKPSNVTGFPAGPGSEPVQLGVGDVLAGEIGDVEGSIEQADCFAGVAGVELGQRPSTAEVRCRELGAGVLPLSENRRQLLQALVPIAAGAHRGREVQGCARQ